jgi:FHA domain
MPTLLIMAGPRAGEEIHLDHETTFGRDRCDVVIADPDLSRRHAVLRPVSGGVEVEDLGSLNGTTIDGERVVGKSTAADGASIGMGASSLTVLATDPEATQIASIDDPEQTVFRRGPEYQPTAVRLPTPAKVTPPVDPQIAAWIGGPDDSPGRVAAPPPAAAPPPPAAPPPAAAPAPPAAPPPAAAPARPAAAPPAAAPAGPRPGRGKPPLFVRIAPKFLLRLLGRRPPPDHGPPD